VRSFGGGWAGIAPQAGFCPRYLSADCRAAWAVRNALNRRREKGDLKVCRGRPAGSAPKQARKILGGSPGKFVVASSRLFYPFGPFRLNCPRLWAFERRPAGVLDERRCHDHCCPIDRHPVGIHQGPPGPRARRRMMPEVLDLRASPELRHEPERPHEQLSSPPSDEAPSRK
jgi:hypothetical protein